MFLNAVLIGLTNLMIHQEWEKEDLKPFNELMISWNGARPFDGAYHIFVSVKDEQWSPWLRYSSWGSDGQCSYLSDGEGFPARVYQDAVELLDGRFASGYKIKVVTEGNASLDAIWGMYVYTNGERTQSIPCVQSSLLPVAGLSQIAIDHPRNRDLCSPTSTAAVVRYLSQDPSIDPIAFAASSWDRRFDIYGNWVLNVAEAAHRLGPNWSCWVERLDGFDAIAQRLMMGTPVIVSVRGPLPGSALPYAKGHLLAVIGYDGERQRVHCMDPAFNSDEETLVSYDLSDFVQAWNRRGRIAYIFSERN